MPIDGNIFSHASKNWQLEIDQDFKPEWFSEKFAEEEMRKALQEVIDKRFVIDRDVKEIKEGRWFFKNGKVDVLGGSAVINQMWGSSQVGAMWESSQVGAMWESSQVKEMRESSQVGAMRESSQVKEMWGSSQVGAMWESSQVGAMWESSQVGAMWGSSLIKDCKGDSPIIYTPDKTIKLKIWKPKK